MKMIEVLVIVALTAVVVALFAWAISKLKNAAERDGRKREILQGYNSHMRRKTFARNVRETFLLLPLLFGSWGRRRGKATLPQFANIGEGTHEHGIKSYIPDAGTNSRYLIYEIGSVADNCRIAGGVNEPLGPSEDQADSNNLDIPIAVKLLGAVKGTVRMTSDGTCINGGRVVVKLDGSGQVADLTASATGHTYWVIGKAIIPTDAVVVAGDPIEVIPYVPYTVAK